MAGTRIDNMVGAETLIQLPMSRDTGRRIGRRENDMNTHRIESASDFLDRISETLSQADAFKARAHARRLRVEMALAQDAAQELDVLKYGPKE